MRRFLSLQTATISKGTARRSGFTLVELLVTIAIISIVLTFSLGAVFLAQESARGARTEAMISKLHNVIVERWESYRTRRLTLLSGTLPYANPVDNRLAAIRDLMRMEMPDRYEDLVFTSRFIPNPGLRQTYLRRIDAARIKYNATTGTSYTTTQFIQNVLGTGTNENESAECLYLLVMASFPADDRAEFRGRENADTNNNFMPEFIDAWGMPIRWLRWAPGVNFSDVQLQDPIDHHDPFDPYGREIGLASDSIKKSALNPATQCPPLASGEPVPFNPGSIQVWGFSMLPFIYSAGSDKEFGIHELLFAVQVPAAPTSTLSLKNENPYSRYAMNATTYASRGEPLAVANNTVNLDNIHNHNPQGANK